MELSGDPNVSSYFACSVPASLKLGVKITETSGNASVEALVVGDFPVIMGRLVDIFGTCRLSCDQIGVDLGFAGRGLPGQSSSTTRLFR